jgi:hypothetical protein
MSATKLKKGAKEVRDVAALYRLGDFTYDAYIELMNMLRKKYRIIPFCEVKDTNVPLLILRHDVDASLEAALGMAEVEKKLGIRSTYFVLFSHKLYNLLEKDSLSTLKKISGLGHEIGLHYDIMTYESYEQAPQKSMIMEIQMLEHLLNKKIFSIACHNVSLINKKDPMKGTQDYLDAYDESLYDLYVSDSCRAWYLEYLNRLLDFKYNRVQLLIHPLLWAEHPSDRRTVYERLFQNVEDKNRKYKSEWLKLVRNNPKVKNYDKLIRRHEYETIKKKR